MDPVARLERTRTRWPRPAAARPAGSVSTTPAASPRGSASICSSIPARSRNSTNSSRIAAATSAWPTRSFRATASSPGTVAWTVGRSTPSRRTSPSSAARCRRPTPPRSSRSWTWPCSMGAPVVGLNDSGGARIQEGVVSLGGYADIFLRNTLASGVVPQISAIMGPCAGGAVYSPAITDFTVMVEGSSYMFVTGPDVIKTVTHEDVTKEALGGAMTHNAHERRGALRRARRSRLPRSSFASCSATCRRTTSTTRRAARTVDPVDREDAALDTLVPAQPNQPYDILDLIHAVVDDGAFLEVHRHFAREHRRGLRPAGRPVGRHRGQSAGRARRVPRYRCVDEGRAVRAVLRRVQYPAHHVRGRAWIPARREPGTRRHHSRRRQAALRVCGSDGAEDHRHHAEGLRRRVLRDGQQAPADGLQLRLSRRPRSR